MHTTDRTRVFEVVAVILTGLGKFLLMDILNQRLLYIVCACLLWAGYVFYKWHKNALAINGSSLIGTQFKKTFLELLPVAILCVGLFVLIGNLRGTNILDISILPILLLYPIWGIVQQYLIIGILAKNLKEVEGARIGDIWIILLIASVFTVVHYPHFLLIGGTFFLALLYTFLYLRKRNLVAMGIFHGWLGAFFFYTILERNPWEEVFGMLVR